ncbi:MAG: TonB family protein [Pseudorhodoplanes sp.]|nr:hypothetical protein [Pseudorhodoplanes sp.]MBW7949823.1 TonB family protein [Pseudorhodoplanes sp.]
MTTKRSTDDRVQAGRANRADDLLGAVVPLRARDLPAPSARSDLSNVIPFVRRARRNAAAIPTLDGAQAARPAPPVPPVERRQTAALVALSLIAHGAVCAAFLREPEPHASIGLISLSVELVLGAQSHAGLSPKPSETETTSLPSPKPDKPQDRTPEAARRDLTVARTPDDAPTDRKPDARETPARKSEQPLSAERTPIPADDAELVATARPADSPSLDAVAPKPADLERKPAPAREIAPKAKKDGKDRRERAAPASSPSTASNSVGLGRSHADTNYRGLVAAHLARYKQFPADARSRGQQGSVTISFSLSGSGSVNAVRLVRGSGVPSIDQEAQAMVRRASPFPSPPDGHAMSFTVPVSFHLR